jgi:hypothetical protein
MYIKEVELQSTHNYYHICRNSYMFGYTYVAIIRLDTKPGIIKLWKYGTIQQWGQDLINQEKN